MATRRNSSSLSKSGMFSGIIVGLIIGLAIAAAAAFYINKAPIPFMDKISPEIEDILSGGGYGVDESLSSDSDPNRGLYGNHLPLESPAFQGKEAEVANALGRIAITPPSPSVPAPVTPKTGTATSENLDTLIAQLNEPQSKAGYFLQAGAFRSAQDAESMRARILLLGLDANVQAGPYEGGTINRVRVGPFSGVDQMNKAVQILSKNKIETSIVRP